MRLLNRKSAIRTADTHIMAYYKYTFRYKGLPELAVFMDTCWSSDYWYLRKYILDQ